MQVIRVKTPISESQIRELKVGDVIYVTGTIITARDEAHKRIISFLREKKVMPIDLRGSVIYHCGPIAKKVGNEWVIVAAGPTTSMRMERFESQVIRNLGVRLIIGKGGMGKKTQQAMRKYGAVYGNFTGGAAVLAAKLIKRVKSVEWLDLGVPEAVWMFEVEDFGPLIVSIDVHGGNLFEEIQKRAEMTLKRIYRKGLI